MSQHVKGTVLITGASSGIGKTCALLLVQSGYRVFASVRSKEVAEHLRSEAPSGLLSLVTLDITDADQIASTVRALGEILGPDCGLTGLVNNAGIAVAGPLELLPVHILRRQFEVNVLGHIAVIQAFLPLIRRGRGRIVNISTASAPLPTPFLGAYVASKIALETLTISLRRELRPWGIQVSIIQPGLIDTPIWNKSLCEVAKRDAELPAHAKQLYADRFSLGQKILLGLRRYATPADAVAEVVLRTLETRRPKTRYRVGMGARLPYLARTLLPDRVFDWLLEKVLTP